MTALVALTALKRHKPEQNFSVHDSTPDHVRHTFDDPSSLFDQSARGTGSMLSNQPAVIVRCKHRGLKRLIY